MLVKRKPDRKKSTWKTCEICSKLTIKTSERRQLLTLNRFHTLFWCSYCWLTLTKCQLGSKVPWSKSFLGREAPDSILTCSWHPRLSKNRSSIFKGILYHSCCETSHENQRKNTCNGIYNQWEKIVGILKNVLQNLLSPPCCELIT